MLLFTLTIMINDKMGVRLNKIHFILEVEMYFFFLLLIISKCVVLNVI